MAAGSKRERIIVADKTIVEGVSSIKTVVRTWQTHSDLSNFAGPQFPVCAIIGRMPVPDEKNSRRDCVVQKIISNLKVDILVYLEINENMDTLVSNIADDLFTALYADQTRGGLVAQTLVKLDEKQQVWPPYAAFRVTCEHKYIHTTEGI